MTRSLLVLNAVLLVAIAGLVWLDRGFESRREEARVVASAFHAIADAATPEVASIRRIEVKLPGSDTTWVAERYKEGWRLPTYRGVYALPDAVDGFLKSLLEGRGTVAGSLARDAARFGLVPGRILDAHLSDATRSHVLHVHAGDVAPGQHSDECFVAVAGEDRVLLLNTNPWAMARLDPSSPFPPFTDTRVIPGALSRPMPATISFSGPEAPAIGPLIRRDTPMEEMQRTMGKGPRFQWFAATPQGERRLNDDAAAAYLNGFLTLAFDELLGDADRHASFFGHPRLVVTVGYDATTSDVLTLGTDGPRGRVSLSNGTTRQAFLISPGRAAALHPDVTALFAAPTSAPTSAPSPR